MNWRRRKNAKVTVDGYELRDMIRTEISAFADMLTDQVRREAFANGLAEGARSVFADDALRDLPLPPIKPKDESEQ